MLISSDSTTGVFFFDESVHDEAGIVLGAFTFFQIDINKQIEELLRKNGFNPECDEYKSRAEMIRNKQMQAVREGIRKLVQSSGRIGIVVAPATERSNLGEEALGALDMILSQNSFPSTLRAYFDEGLFRSVSNAESCYQRKKLDKRISCLFEQDSIMIRGLQTADYVAHTCATRLKAALLGKDKLVDYEPINELEPDKIPLSFELFTSLRNNMLVENTAIAEHGIESFFFKSTGLWISDKCDIKTREATNRLFSKVYLGCVH